MSPRDLDSQVLIRRVAAIEELLGALEPICASTASGALDITQQLALERILTSLVDLAIGINTHVAGASGRSAVGTYRESFEITAELGVISQGLRDELLPSVGMRNVLTHEYVNIDRARVAASAPLALTAYRAYIAAIRTWLGGRPGPA